MTMTIDTLATAKDLEKAGFSQDQAEGLAEKLKEAAASEIKMTALEGRVTLLTWMVGTNIGLTLLVLGKLFGK
jgi:hypothetical protein